MKEKLKIIITILLIIAIVISGWFFQKHEKEKEAEEEKAEVYSEYKQAASHMYMDLDESKYNRTERLEDLVLIPTESTFDLLSRWEFISDKFPEIIYPKEKIQEEDWLQVLNILANNAKEMEEASIDIGEELASKHGENESSTIVYSYIYYNNIISNHFKEFLEDRGMEY